MPAAFDLHLAGGFSRDAIVNHNGEFETDRIGGNALFAAMAARLAGAAPFVHSVVGRGYPESALARIAALGVDTTGVRRNPASPGVRVTFSYAADGSRSQPAIPEAIATVPESSRGLFLDTTRDPAVILESLPTAADLPAENASNGWHLGLLPIERFRELVGHLRSSAYLQVDSPARFELARDNIDVLGDTLADVDVFLPSTSDTDVFAPARSRTELLALFHELGAATVVLKCGEDGALLSERGGAVWHVPIFADAASSDPTGAGDAFAGAFAATIARGDDLLTAACAGAAAASIGTTVRDPFGIAEASRSEFDRRRYDIRQRVERL